MRRIIGIVAIFFLVVLLLGVALRVGLGIAVYDSVVGYSVRTFDLDPSLAKGLAWFGVALASLVPPWFLWRPSRRFHFIPFVLVGLLTLWGWWVHRDDLFTRQGQPVRYMAVTNSGLVLSQHPGVDPKSGVLFQPVTDETAPIVTLWLKTGGLPPLQDQPCTPAFSVLNGQALCWYEVTPQGVLFSRLPGYSPIDGQRLQPVTHSIIEDWQQRHEFRQKLDAILTSPTGNHLHVALISPSSAGGVSGTNISAGSDDLPAGTKFAVSIKFHPLNPESLGLDRLTPASIAVYKAIGLWPGQRIFLRVPEEIDGAGGDPIIATGSTAEALIAVNTYPNNKNQLLVSISVIRLYLPQRRHAIPMVAHLDPSCAAPLMNFQVCDLVLDQPFSRTTPFGTDSSLRASTARSF